MPTVRNLFVSNNGTAPAIPQPAHSSRIQPAEDNPVALDVMLDENLAELPPLPNVLVLLSLLFTGREPSPSLSKWVLYYFCYLPGVSHPLVYLDGCFF